MGWVCIFASSFLAAIISYSPFADLVLVWTVS